MAGGFAIIPFDLAIKAAVLVSVFLAVARAFDGQEVVFFGPVLPHPESARQILERALARKLPPISDESARGLFSRFVQAGLVGES